MVLGIDASRANVREKTGVEWYAWRIIQEFKGIIPAEIKVILYSREPLEGALSTLPSHWESRVLHTPFNRLWTQVGLSWEMLRRAPDVLFVPAHVIPPIHPRAVVTIHDVASERYPSSYSGFERWYHRYAARYAVQNAFRIIAPSRFTAQEIYEVFGPPRGGIEVIHLGADASVGDAASAADVTRLTGLPTEPYILHIGRLERKKGTIDLLRAFEIIKEDSAHNALHLVLIGRSGYGHREADEMIERSPFKSRIHRLGWLAERDKQAVLRGAHLFVFPSQYEGFGIPLLEAASCGVPVVARRAGSLPEIAGQNLVRWFDDPAELPILLKDALQDSAWHLHVRQTGPRHATRFSWHVSALRTYEVLRRALLLGDTM